MQKLDFTEMRVRNDTELVIEQAHAKLDDIHKDFMDKIDNHEKECQEKFKSKNFLTIFHEKLFYLLYLNQKFVFFQALIQTRYTFLFEFHLRFALN
jgi:hypothetical protein